MMGEELGSALRQAACTAIAKCADISKGVKIDLDAGYSPAHAAETMRVAIIMALHKHMAASFKRDGE